MDLLIFNLVFKGMGMKEQSVKKQWEEFECIWSMLPKKHELFYDNDGVHSYGMYRQQKLQYTLRFNLS